MPYCSSLIKKQQHVPYLCVQFDTLHAIISISKFLCLLSCAIIQGLHRSKSSLLTNLWVLLQQFLIQETHLNHSGKYTYHSFQHSVSLNFTHTYKHTQTQHIHIHYIDSKFSHSNNRLWNKS